MAFEITKWCMICTTICVVLLSAMTMYVVGEPQVPCFFIFGDSIVDNGNNNNLVTLAKSNFLPYGIDTPTCTPTGRFTNNRTIVDITGHSLPLIIIQKCYSFKVQIVQNACNIYILFLLLVVCTLIRSMFPMCFSCCA